MLSADRVRVSFGDRVGVADASLAVPPGRVVGLIGPNGSGKTTLLRTLYRSLAPDTGTVELDGRPLAAQPRRVVAARVAVVAQEPVADLTMTVAEMVLLGRSPHRSAWTPYTRADHELAAAVLRRVGLRDRADDAFGELSGGERQRVLIARALAQEADHLLLDEPTNHLDIRYQHEILALVRSLGVSAVVVLHDLNLAARYCDELVLLDRGRVVATGSPDAVLHPDVLDPVYGVSAQRVTTRDGHLQLVFGPPAPSHAADLATVASPASARSVPVVSSGPNGSGATGAPAALPLATDGAQDPAPPPQSASPCSVASTRCATEESGGPSSVSPPVLPAEVRPTPPGSPVAIDDLDHGRRRRRALRWTVGALGLVAVAVTVGVALGPVPISPVVVWEALGHHTVGVPADASWTTSEDNIVWLVRAPRTLLAVIVGAGLATSGVAMQALLRNVLAEPYLLGVSSGASCGAALTILFGVGAGLGTSALSVSAFLGGMAALGLVFALASLGGRPTAVRLVLAGVAVSYALSALTSFLIFAADTREGARAVLFWLLGGLDQARWSSLAVPAVTVVATVVVLTLMGRSLDALVAGDDSARALGVDPARFRAGALAVVALSVGVVVAVSGAIGFVGLLVPHVARRFVGGEHRKLLPVAALGGGAFLVAADVVARTAFSPSELPLGIVTALVGAPFVVVLLRHRSTGPQST
jgi:iron complex transport system permease protein